MPISGFEQYHALRRRAPWARAALVAKVAVDLVAVFTDLEEDALLERLETEDVPPSEPSGARSGWR